MNLGVLDPAQQAANEAAKAELLKLVERGAATLMVGAGSSAAIGYKAWNPLLQHFESEARRITCPAPFAPNPTKLSDLPLEYAEDLETFLEGHQPRWFRRQLELLYRNNSVPLQNFHRELVTLPFKAIMTTNYDTVLSRALSEAGQAPTEDTSFFLSSQGSPYLHEFLSRIQEYQGRSSPMRIFHIHGRYDQPDEAILTARDYRRAYGYNPAAGASMPAEWELRRKLLWALPAMSRLVFAGFTLDDPYFRAGLRTVSTDLWTHSTTVHYALMGISNADKAEKWNKAEALKRHCAVQVVFAEEEPNSYTGLPELVGDLATYCKTRPVPRLPGARHDPFRP